MSKKNKKNILLISLLFLIIISATVFIINKINTIRAEDADAIDNKTIGWAYGENIGWISMNSANCDENNNNFIDTKCSGDDSLTPIVDYGVKANIDTGEFSGYAWSEFNGWIYFGPDATLLDYGLVQANSAPSDPKIWAKFDKNSGVVTGWAKILSAGTDGWIKMSDDSWKDYGVKIATTTGHFSGWAWNGDNTNVGWINFNFDDLIKPSLVDYKVDYPPFIPPEKPSDVSAVVVDTSCCGATVTWTDNSIDETGFRVEKSADQNNWTLFCENKNKNNQIINPKVNCYGQTLDPNGTYYFRVRAEKIKGNSSEWVSDEKGYLTNYCPPVLSLDPKLTNCEGVALKWEQTGTGVDHYDIYRKEGLGDWGSPLVKNVASSTREYFDSEIGSGKKYNYRIVAQTRNLESNMINANPCPTLPTWREVKPAR